MPGALEALDDILAGLDGGTLTRYAAASADQVAQSSPPRCGDALPATAGSESARRLRFSFQPSINREQLDSLHTLGFLERKANVVFLGPPGVGKTHLAISLAIAAAAGGRRVYYGTLGDLITSLEEASQAGRLLHRMKTLSFPSLLTVDEIGYLAISPTGAMLFFQRMSRRSEHALTVLTSNKGFEEWGDVFDDDVMAAAPIDRLVQHCHIVNIRGNSYRMRHHAELHRALGTSRLASRADTPPRARLRRKEGTAT
jgi:DNA replication protein DnaC